jgi:hypothetical protein
MRLTEFLVLAVASVACAPRVSCAASAELLDLAGRIHYGFYQSDVRVIDAAQPALDRLAASADVLYYRDFAALRRAQLGALDREGAKRLNECVVRDVGADVEKRAAAEAWVLIAACALVAGDQRRFEQGLARARAIDDDHPRIALLEAWRIERSDSPDAGALEKKLTAAAELFDSWTPTVDDPDWGHAEALVALAESALDRGEARAARDLIERALLLAPDYRRAVELRAAMQGVRGGTRGL